ncbi:hypothetical protein [Streptomyces sp. DH8]|uniref:hypothetical protein n=1 Tax=Streptomyces sp. DH8 TaxID=2857008 RepID=UPI001E587CC4|nr:hypothetical protein [Streptomyces sp. DH8]
MADDGEGASEEVWRAVDHAYTSMTQVAADALGLTVRNIDFRHVAGRGLDPG